MVFTRSFIGRAMCFCLSAAMAATTLGAAEDSVELVLSITDKTVEVSDRSGGTVQSLPLGGDAPDESNREYFAIVEDMDFDGFPDVRVLFSQGMVNLYYDCWLWRPEENAFVRLDDMRELSNPAFDRSARTIRVYERGSAMCHVKGELAWENGELVWLSQTVQDEAGDGENIVVRHSLRGRDGELRLVDEKTFRIDDPDGEEAGVVCLPPELSGLHLVLDVTADPLDAAILPNGEWWLHQGLPDRSMLIESRRLPPLEPEAETLRRLLRAEWPLARDIEAASFPALAEKTGCPAFKATFLTGKNEDTRQFAAAMTFTKEWSFCFVLSASADAELSPGDGTDDAAFTRGERLQKDMEAALLGVKPADAVDGGFFPDSIPAFYLAGPDSTLPISIMDALIRIKKLVGPEHSPWIDQGASAYRYDGPGTVAGKPALQFSFGADTPEKFTAERHFAVDAEGAVYEMDVLAGGEYWEWEEYGAVWWGEYHGGEMLLRIHNYREGPFGMYFVFDFSSEGKTVFEGVATVRGRTARCDSLVFFLSDDDKSVVVAVDPETDGEGEFIPGLDGVYRVE